MIIVSKDITINSDVSIIYVLDYNGRPITGMFSGKDKLNDCINHYKELYNVNDVKHLTYNEYLNQDNL